jgi:COX assembly mitochondrial protein 1
MEMAASVPPDHALGSSAGSRPIQTVRQNNLRNPLPLSPSQESEIRQLYHKRARDRCQPVIKAFAECATGRTVSVAWACKDKQMAMNSCIMQYATKAEEDAAREEWFAGLMARKREKEQAKEKNEEVKKRVLAMAEQVKERDRQEAEKKIHNNNTSTGSEAGTGREKSSRSWWR